MPRRFAATATLALGASALALMVFLAVREFPRALFGALLLILAARTAWDGLVRRGPRRVPGFVTSGLLAAGGLVLLLTASPALVLGFFLTLAAAVVTGRAAFRIRVQLPPAPRPAHPVMFWNPRSGDGKAVRLQLAKEARARGITPIELGPRDQLEQLVLRAVENGADALAMAGGDGSQAVVARIAADRGLPYACIPAGTRNHFALDLGVDRDDVVGALDAFVDGGERRVDLGEVNGVPFVNNVSLGLYGSAVQRAEYRGAKLRTLLEVVLEVSRPGVKTNLRWRGPGDARHEGAAAIIVSNNCYRFGNTFTAGTRPRLDGGVLGVIVLDPAREKPQQWSTTTFEVEADSNVAAGMDGEARLLVPPLRFHVRPGALRCRVACSHPGASPSAYEPEGTWDALRLLAGIASGRLR